MMHSTNLLTYLLMPLQHRFAYIYFSALICSLFSTVYLYEADIGQLRL